MRAFISIEIPEKIKQEIERIQKQIPEFKGKSVEKENLHLTLKFLGEISQELVDNVKSRLFYLKFKPIKLELNAIGTFSYQNNPRIVWLKINGAEELQKKIDIALSELFPEEERFMSHLTIARIKYVNNKKEFENELSSIKINSVSWEENAFKLMHSVLTPNGPIHTPIKEYKSQEN